ncbi:formylmethanofuran dehydrogenase subunit E [Methanosarcina thermophila]|uniref:Formylmethanofuran dehydrogenase subunit E n=1 Tax=Methanosarcina thermophila TaxID=2210 RepID=A0A1I7ALX6_METTE|nr:hypothetical protein [Methanosarcina thermophila]SFT75948.1 formylmethanofuran dehydrogenase subunit E [Methanosarcina thermophila]BAW30227.1 formylmethanofuran dehydrogenase subunit E [Methanosarcina thermophila]GLI14786.1 hypothetical protein MTHERMMSTA1_19120 [Methanosarcina thermophila MST-A1]HOA70124.1 hypothetical protein [Methanosarcina thermophila]HOQ66886.1 hypothetical protein [Methanosarcina thermophila]
MHKNSQLEKENIEAIMKQIKDPELLSQIEKVIPFHGFLTFGALIGIQISILQKKHSMSARGSAYMWPPRLKAACLTHSRSLLVLQSEMEG